MLIATKLSARTTILNSLKDYSTFSLLFSYSKTKSNQKFYKNYPYYGKKVYTVISCVIM